MGLWTDWFIADESEAEAIASIADDEGSDFDDWPHLGLNGIIESQLMALWGVLQGKPGEWPDVVGGALHQDGEAGEGGEGEDGLTLVSRVAPEFVIALAELSEPPPAKVVKAWLADASMADWKAAEAKRSLAEMTEFAQHAVAVGKPVLQLSVV